MNINIELKSLNIEPLAMAKYFYERGITSHLFIQKLIYFAFLKGLKNGLLLFEEKFQAWKFGSVLRSVWEVMADKEENLDPRLARVLPVQNEEVLALLEEIYQEYKDCDVWDLVNKSHDEAWEKARKGLDREESFTAEITLVDLIKFVVGDYLEIERDKVHYEKTHEAKTPQEKILWEVLTKLENASGGCVAEIDLPYLGESLLEKCRELASFSPVNAMTLNDLQDRLKKIRNCEIDPDYNIEMAKFICQKMLSGGSSEKVRS